MTATIQVANSDNAVQLAEFWLKLNGQLYPNSATNITLPPRKNVNEPGYDLATITFVGTSTAPNDYVQIFWQGTHAGVYLEERPSNDIPETPSAILAITQVTYNQLGPTGPTGPTGATPTAPLTLTQSSNNANYPLTISSANEQGGGAGWSDILKITNSKAGVSNPHKHIRMNGTGGLEIVNSAYSDTIFYLADNGNLSELGTVNGATLEDTGWTAVTSFFNGYSGSGSPAYRRINNVVYLRGRVSGGGANSLAFNLPSGYRPAVDTVIAVQQFGTSNINYVTVNPDGNVVPNGTAAWLSGVIFPIG
jgi:hypothetical protein